MEIERKYLVNENFNPDGLTHDEILQNYICKDENTTVRVRIINNKGYVTIKSTKPSLIRDEFEFKLPLKEAKELLFLNTKTIINKTRYYYDYEGHIFEIDVFNGLDKPLIIAEVELSDINEKVKLPNFIGEEVTGNPDYYNQNIKL